MELNQPRKLLISIKQTECESEISCVYNMSQICCIAHVRDATGAKKLRS